jgi:hypothetical protein
MKHLKAEADVNAPEAGAVDGSKTKESPINQGRHAANSTAPWWTIAHVDSKSPQALKFRPGLSRTTKGWIKNHIIK